MRHFVFLISLVTNMLERWDIIHWKGGIHSFVWSTKSFLYNIKEPRYKQNNMGYHFILLIFQLPNIVQKCVCTLDGATDPIFVAGDIIHSNNLKVIFWATLYKVYFEKYKGTF